jgi:ribosome maturation factor RimP
MDRHTHLTERIKALVLPLLNRYDVELIDVELKGSSGSQVLRIYADVEGGITLQLCEQLSREISDLLDMKNIINGKYRLEVSSPGTDRPLKTANDFLRNRGRSVSITMDEHSPLEGIIKEVADEQVILETDEGEVSLSLSSVKLAKLVLAI